MNSERRRDFLTAFVAFLSWSATLGAQAPTLRADQDVQGRKGWVLETDRIHMGLLQNGGHMAEIRLISDNPRLSINPMFIPTGNGYMGHMVCFPNVGPASPEERQNGIGGHGEANGVVWQQSRPPQIDAQSITFFYGAELPKTQDRIERAVSLKSGSFTIHIEEWIENLTPYDRPYNYDQHPTFGAPFVAPQKNVLDMPGTKGMTDSRRTAGNQWAPGRESSGRTRCVKTARRWTCEIFMERRPGRRTRRFALIPRAQRVRSRSTTLITLLVGDLFPTLDNPWIIDWQNRPRADSPAGTARAIMFKRRRSTKASARA